MDLNNDRGIRDTVIVCCIVLGLVLLAILYWNTRNAGIIALFIGLCIASHFLIRPKTVK